MKKLLILFALIFSAVNCHAGGTLTVDIKDPSGAPVNQALVALIAFSTSSTSSGGGEAMADNSFVRISTAAGRVFFTISPNINYMLVASKQGMSPTIKEQIQNPTFINVTSLVDLSKVITLRQDGALMSAAGSLKIIVTGIVGNKFVMCDVRNNSSNESVAYSAAEVVAATATLNILNVPAASSNTYTANIGVPGTPYGTSIVIYQAVFASTATPVPYIIDAPAG
jgi:hypothetical protein